MGFNWLFPLSGNVWSERLISPGHVPVQKRVGPAVNDVQLTDLFPNTEYVVTVQAALHDLASEPVTAREVTCKTLLISQLSFCCNHHVY